MAIVIIEENKDIRGYFSIKGHGLNKSLEYYIETQNSSGKIQFDIVYIIGDKGFVVKTIKEKNTNSKNIYKGSIKNITFLVNEENIENEGVCILDKNDKILFAEYLNKKKIDMKDIKIKNKQLDIENCFHHKPLDLKSNNETTCDFLFKNKEKSLDIPICNIKPIRDRKISIREVPFKLKSNTNEFKVSEFTKALCEKATTVKQTKIYSKDDLVIRISYFLFRDAFIKDNEYFLIIDTIINLFKDNIKKYGHFLISIIFRRNGQIKYIQIGIPDKEAFLSLEHLNSIKYKQITKSNNGYWFYKYEL